MLNSTFPTKRYDNDRMVCILPRPIYRVYCYIIFTLYAYRKRIWLHVTLNFSSPVICLLK